MILLASLWMAAIAIDVSERVHVQMADSSFFSMPRFIAAPASVNHSKVSFDDYAEDIARRFANHFAPGNGSGDDGAHECVHSKLPRVPYRTVAQSAAKQRAKRDDPDAPRVFGGLRVLFDTRFVNDQRSCRAVGQESIDEQGLLPLKCKYEDILTPKKAEFLLGVLRDASEFLSTGLFVERFDRALKLVTGDNVNLCDVTQLPVPPEYIGAGVSDADLVIFVTTWPANPRVRGFAQPCLFDEQSGRPIAGYINFNPAKLDSVATMFPTGIHELFHVLGFKRNVFTTFRFGPDYMQLKESFIIALATQQRESLVTKNALQRAREHFECPALAGVPLESKNGDVGDHWEKTTLGDELMTAALAPRFPPLSHMTLAAFEDSGWYRVDYRRASRFVYGRGQGCAFLDVPCDMRTVDGYGACVAKTSCAFDQSSYGTCPKSNAFLGPCLVPDTTVSCAQGVEQSTGAVVDPADIIGADSRCFMSKLVGDELHANCLRHRCADGILSIELFGKWHECGAAPSILAIDGRGELQCPASSDLCCDCPNGGVCLRGKCACPPGFVGANCSTALPLPIGSLAETRPDVALKPANPIVDVPSSEPVPPVLGIGEIVGIAVGGVVCIVLCFVILVLAVRARRQRRLDDAAFAVLSGRSARTRAATPPEPEPMAAAATLGRTPSGARTPPTSGREEQFSTTRGNNSGAQFSTTRGNNSGAQFSTTRGAQFATTRGNSNNADARGNSKNADAQFATTRGNSKNADAQFATTRGAQTTRQAPTNLSRQSKHQAASKLSASVEFASPLLYKARALWACTAEEHDELSFNAGDLIDVLDDSDPEWWVCRLRGAIGTAPSSFLEATNRDFV
jgi:leishmanolysin